MAGYLLDRPHISDNIIFPKALPVYFSPGILHLLALTEMVALKL